MSHSHVTGTVARREAHAPRRSGGRVAVTVSSLLSLASLFVLSGFASPSAAHAASPLADKADSFIVKQAALPAASRTGWSSVIVRFDDKTSDVTADATLRRVGGYAYRHLPIIHSVAARIPTRRLESLADLAIVKRLSLDATVRKTDEFTVGDSGADVAAATYGVTGKGVTVAVVDSGIADMKDLGRTTGNVPLLPILPIGFTKGPSGSRIVAQYNVGQGDAVDKCGHGTHVAGIIGGNGSASTGKDYFRTFNGIAPNVNLVNVAVLNDDGSGSVSNVVAGINAVVLNRVFLNVRVLNLSLGHVVGESYLTDPLCQAVEAAWRSGIVVVCSAGNDGRYSPTVNPNQGNINEGYGTNYGSIQSPGNDPYVITVGAMKAMGAGRTDDRIATYSSRGPTRLDHIAKPDIVAPGNQVISLEVKNGFLATNYAAYNQIPVRSYSNKGSDTDTSDKYFQLSGTSMAAPVVAGAVALMLEKNPLLSPDTIKARLMISADKWVFPDGTTDMFTFGAGFLDIPGALSSNVVTLLPAISPKVVLNLNGTVSVLSSLISNPLGIWGMGSVSDSQAIWGTRAMQSSTNGNNTVNSNQAIWGTRSGGTAFNNNTVFNTFTSDADLSSTALKGEK